MPNPNSPAPTSRRVEALMATIIKVKVRQAALEMYGFWPIPTGTTLYRDGSTWRVLPDPVTR